MTPKRPAASGTAPQYNWGGNRQIRTITGESMAKQSMAAECDVNKIVARYDRTGVINHLQTHEGVFADVSEIGSYSDAIQNVQSAQNAFLELPSGLRAHFDNDPSAYLDWATTASEDDRSELYEQLTGSDKVADPTPPPASPPAEEPETGD